jgi:integrase
MKYDQLPSFIAMLREREALAARCLEFAILTAARSSEALGAKWDEMDLRRKVWTILAHRMKAGREHRIPLSDRALAILIEMRDLGDPVHVFSGQRRGKPLSAMAMEMVLRRMEITGATVHGFRSSFRDWAGNCTNFPRELAEHAMSHVIGDKAEQAYRRDDALERRRPLMQAWAKFCEPTARGVVVPMRGTR